MQLIKNIEGIVYNNIIGNVTLVKSISGVIQQEDYINLNGFVGYLQKLTRTEQTSALTKPFNFGLPNKNNITMVTLEINY